MVVPTTIASFDAFEATYADLLFDRHKTVGLIPYNVGLLKHGRLMFAIVGRTEEEVEAAYQQFQEQTALREGKFGREQRSWQAA
jgi:hypothetical protein